MQIILVNGGGSSPFDKIALNNGWKLGINSREKRSTIKNLFMIDNHFTNYNHERHLTIVKKHRPNLATIQDILEDSDQDLIFSQALELKEYCTRLILIPKCKITNQKLFKIPHLMIGLPCGQFKNKWSRYYANNLEFDIHLLGGSPKSWKEEINNYQSRIYSADGNYLCKVSRLGLVYINFRTRKPHYFEVKEGKGFPYRCFDFSLSNFKTQDLFEHKQLSFEKLLSY